MLAQRPKVLLILPRFRARLHALFPGVSFLAGSLRRFDCDVAVFDDDVAIYAERRRGHNADHLLEQFYRNFNPDLIGIYVNTPNYRQAIKVAERVARFSSSPIVAGGPHATLAGEAILRHHSIFTAVLGGEGEFVLPALAWALVEEGDIDRAVADLDRKAKKAGIPLIRSEYGDFCDMRSSISFLRKNHIYTANFVLPDLSDIALPDRNALLAPPAEALMSVVNERYRQNFFHALPPFANCFVLTSHVSRGCYGKCPFCAPAAIFKDRQGRRLRPLSHIQEELTQSQNLGFNAWYFDEPAFPLAPSDWSKGLQNILRDMGYPWGCVARLDEIRKSDMKAWHSAGLRYLYFGLETPQQKLQKGLGKAIDPDLAIETVNYLHNLGIQCDLSVFFGMPGENEHTIRESINWLEKHLPLGNVFFSLAAYWPGTAWSQQGGLRAEHWEPAFIDENKLDGFCWYPETEEDIEIFFSNSTGTYHPEFLTLEVARRIKSMIIESGLRDRFARFSRNISNTRS